MANISKKISEIIADNRGEELLAAIANFSCKDKDVERFLKTKALESDKRNKSRTYIVIEDEQVENGKLEILAYFTLMFKVLYLGDSVSKSVRKAIDGFNKDVPAVAVLLIGQFGKDENAARDISGEVFLKFCLSVVREIRELAGGRVVLLECLPIPQVVDFYERSGFTYLQTDPRDKYRQLILPL
ncbi:MAG: hypothetical protein LBM98_07635 [Oscillospiraceae bacterium]|nr:hypothetical protein [Oscillospiraceae bacterium]